jgi:thiol-disulfide isomerase/thioredoxin
MKHCIILLLLAIVTGPAWTDETADKKPAQADAKATSAISLQVASWEQAKKIVASNKGKVVVLDLWSTGCQPCVKEFPQLVKLQANHPQDVVCISFNTNYIGVGKPEDEQEDVLKFLTRQNARLINLLSSEADEDLYKRVGIASIPVVQVYDRTGKLAKQFDNEQDAYGKDGFTYEKHIVPLVKKLVESK